MSNIEGFVLSNKFRKAVFLEISSGENSLERIAKKHHLLPQMVKKVAQEMVDKGLIKEKDGAFELTEKGEKIFGKLKGSNAI